MSLNRMPTFCWLIKMTLYNGYILVFNALEDCDNYFSTTIFNSYMTLHYNICHDKVENTEIIKGLSSHLFSKIMCNSSARCASSLEERVGSSPMVYFCYTTFQSEVKGNRSWEKPTTTEDLTELEGTGSCSTVEHCGPSKTTDQDTQ